MANSIPLIYEIDVQIPSAGNITKKLQKQLAGADQSADALSRSILQVGESAEKTSQEVAQSSAGLGKFTNAARRAKQEGVGFTRGAGNAATTLTNFNRVVQDAPFGLIGIANNIDPLVSSFQSLRAQTGSAGSALKSLIGSLAGPQGVLFAVSAVTSILVAFGPKIKEFFTDTTEEATESAKDFTQSLIDARTELSKLSGDTPFDTIKNNLILVNQQLAPFEEAQQRITELREEENRLLSAGLNDQAAELTRERLRLAESLQGKEETINQLKERRNELIDKAAQRQRLENSEVFQNIQAQKEQLELLQSNLQTLEKQDVSGILDLGLDKEENDINTLLSGLNLIQSKVSTIDTGTLGPQGIDDDLANQGQSNIDARRQELTEEDRIEQRRRKLIADTARFRIQATQNALNAVTSILQAFGVKNKAISLGILAVEKGLAIARVAVDTSQKVAQATAQAAVLASNPATLGLVPNALAQAAAIKTAGATAIAAIAAQGLAEAGGILSGGGGGGGIAGGAGGGGGAGGSAASTGFSVSDSRNTREAQRSNVNARDNREPRIEFRPRLTLDERGLATSVRRGESKLAETETRVG